MWKILPLLTSKGERSTLRCYKRTDGLLVLQRGPSMHLVDHLRWAVLPIGKIRVPHDLVNIPYVAQDTMEDILRIVDTLYPEAASVSRWELIRGDPPPPLGLG